MPIHLRQFVIGPEPKQVQPDWRSRQLPSGLFLSHCPTLPIADTPFGTVLGDWIPMDDGGGPSSWAGRWLLLTATQLRLDTCGLLGCSYRDIDTTRWISSSPEILRALEPELPMHDDRLERDWRVMDWYPPPASAIKGIARLLPSQALSLPGGALVPVALPTGQAETDYETVLQRSQQRLVTAMRHTAALAAESGGRVWIGLTGGHDSRTLVAAALAAGIEAVTYTFIRPQTSSGDREMPPLLAKAAGFEYVAIPLDGLDRDRTAEFDRHTAASYVGGAWLQHGTRAWEHTESAAVVLEGGCFEVARCYYWPRLPTQMGETPEEATATILKRFPSQRPEGVRGWVDWVRGAGRQDELEWRDRFFLEQRCGGWLSAGLQGFDLSG
ncbi:MAG: hypothetical protein ACC726_13925, partial [Chloroflexota bacterium]